MLLLIINTIIIVLTFNVSLLVRFGNIVNAVDKHYSTFVFIVLYTLIILYFYEFFQRYIYIGKLKLFFNVVKAWLSAVVFYLAVGFLTKYYFLVDSRAFIIFYFFFLLCFMILFHLLIIPRLLNIYYKSSNRRITCQFIGPSRYLNDFKNFINKHSLLGLALVESSNEATNMDKQQIQEFFLYSNAKSYCVLYEEIKSHLTDSNPLHVVSQHLDKLNLKWEWAHFRGLPIYTFQKKDNKHIRKVARRTIDIIGAFVFIVLLSPFLLTIALAVKLDSRGSVLFKQKRCGCNGNQFIMYKFRTMVENKDKDKKREFEFKNYLEDKTNKGKVLNHDEITQIGTILRRTSLDELPQLWSVLCGHMSLVGPRPPIPYEVKYYRDWHKDRLSVKPGLTGLWQVYGRGTLPCDPSIFLDLMYAINRSLSLDIKLLLQTIPAVILGKGAY